jgi:hypothetical protein
VDVEQGRGERARPMTSAARARSAGELHTHLTRSDDHDMLPSHVTIDH